MSSQLALRSETEPDIAAVRRRLAAAFGAPTPLRRRDPVSQLVRSMLGSRTPDAVADMVFDRLRLQFRPWARLAEARPEEVLRLIRPVAAPEAKADQLIRALRQIHARGGRLSLDALADWPLDEAMDWLEALPGVGQKVAAAVLNLSTLQRRVLVVDSRLHRVCRRLGLAPEAADPAAVRAAVMDAAPSEWTAEDFTALHRLLKRLGQLHCHERQPDCGGCPLVDACASAPARNKNKPETSFLDGYLRRRMAAIEARGTQAPSGSGLQLGRELDAAFAAQALPPGMHQSCPASPHDLAAPLMLPLAAALRLRRPHRRLLVVQEREARREGGELYGPGLQALGLDPAEALFVRLDDPVEALRVTEEALRLRAAPVVLMELRRGEALADLSVSRRLDLAARGAGAFVFLVTPDLSGASAAITRWRIASASSRAPKRRLGRPAFHFSLLRNRRGRTGDWTLEWSADDRRFASAEALPAPVDAAPRHRPGAPLAAGSAVDDAAGRRRATGERLAAHGGR